MPLVEAPLLHLEGHRLGPLKAEAREDAQPRRVRCRNDFGEDVDPLLLQAVQDVVPAVFAGEAVKWRVFSVGSS